MVACGGAYLRSAVANSALRTDHGLRRTAQPRDGNTAAVASGDDRHLLPAGLEFPRTEAEAAATAAQGLPSDGWYDLSTPLWERFHANRLSAYARVAYPQLRATLEYSSGGPDLVRLAEACQQGDRPACESYEAQRDSARARAGRLLARIASAFCNEVLADQPVTHVALKLRERPIAAWTERHDAPPTQREVELGVFPVDRSVTATAIWRDGRPE
jgi:hypothetical protein